MSRTELALSFRWRRFRAKTRPSEGSPQSAATQARNVVGDDVRGHYDILGLPRTATSSQIRAAYRRMALLTHPDKGGRAGDFQKIVNSWEILTDPEARKEYDDQCTAEGSQDGLGTTQQAAPGTPGKIVEECADQSRERGMARVSLIQLLQSEPSGWMDRLRELDRKVLASLHEYMCWSQMPRVIGRARGRNPEDYPREVAPPGWMPDGWKCIENMYRDGKNAGLTYMRFTSPWGHKHVGSMRKVIMIDAAIKDVDPGPLLARYLASLRGRNPDRGRNASEVATPTSGYQTKVQKGIYASSGSYHVNVNFAYFRIITKKTRSLDRAVEWHIALTEMVKMSEARRRRHVGDDPDPLTEEEWHQCLTRVPDLHVSFSSNFNSPGGYTNVFTPTTHNLQQAVFLHHRFNRLVKGRVSIQEIQQVRSLACEDYQNFLSEQRGLMEQIAENVREILEQYGVTATLPARAVCPAIAAGPSGSKSSASSACPPSQREPASSAPAPQLNGRVRNGNVRVAMELQAALGLDNASASLLTQHLRALPPAQLSRRLKVLAAPFAGTGTGRGLQALLAPSKIFQTGRPDTTPERRALALPGSTPPEQQQHIEDLRVSRPPKRRSSYAGADNDNEYCATAASSSLALSPYKLRRPGEQPLALDCREEQPSKRQRRSTILQLEGAKEVESEPQPFDPSDCLFFPGFLPATEQSSCFTIMELSRLRTISVRTSRAANLEMRARLRNFVYTRNLLASAPRRSRTGRCVSQNVVQRWCPLRLVRFMTHRSQLPMFENIDLRYAPFEALENESLRASFSKMTRLKHVTLPENGWSTPSERVRFLRALPETVTHDRR